MEKKISPRKPHFSIEEVDVIVEGVQENYSNLFGALSPYLDQNKKKALWSSIVQKVNSISSVVRTITEVKHKWQDLQLKSKKKESERNRLQNLTGGGPAPPALTPLELKVISIIPKVACYGIPGGIDTDSESSVQIPDMTNLPTLQLPVSQNEQTDPIGSADDNVNILIDLSTGKEIRINENEETLCGIESRPKEQISPPSKNRTGKTVESDSTSKLLIIEQEKLQLKKRKIELMEERNDLERKKLKFFELIAEKLSVVNEQ
ncbi:myb-related transcription factor, partner of profilin-like isoform X1 [Mytilus galloprovincialis]|uniref:myb-related transcription factor, partner of profilin-like isoform X1 n=1 Tax=Mytilus galloprovincialis TaxID=29158 RepID=UPI003F7C8DC2